MRLDKVSRKLSRLAPRVGCRVEKCSAELRASLRALYPKAIEFASLHNTPLFLEVVYREQSMRADRLSA